MVEPTGVLQGRYQIIEPIARGGMGAVYLAEDQRLPGRVVAIKENLAASAGSRHQFEREAVILARLRHPNLPQVTDCFVEGDGKQYLVMEYVPGENLQQILTRLRGPLPADQALAIIQEVMAALAYLHAWRDPKTGQLRPVIHRDIKPANIKRTPEGRIVLVDFGIAKVDSGTMTGTAMSAKALTPGYAPLEQYSGGTDARSDIYALGATLYALLTGKAPPTATDMAMVGAKQRTPLLGGLKTLPPAIARVIERAMQSLPEDRYQSIAAMYQALYHRSPAGDGVNQATMTPMPMTPRIRRPAFVIGVLGVLLATAGMGWLLFAQSTENPATATKNALVVAAPTALPVLTATAPPAPTDTPASPVAAAVVAAIPLVAPVDVETPAPSGTPVLTPADTPTSTPLQIEILAPTLAAATAASAPPTPEASETPTAVAPPTATGAPIATPTATRTDESPTAVVQLDPLNLRAGPDTTFALVTVLRAGDVLTVLGKTPDAGWLQVRTEEGRAGWVAAAYVTTTTPLDRVAVVAAPPTPAACTIAVADELYGRWNRSELGCPVTLSAVVWAAYQPFEGGLMLWRQDTDQAYVFYNRGDWFASNEDWPEGAPVNNRGGAPSGLQEPHRGFGYLWGRDDAVFARLGWATDTEKGFCLRVQGFEHGFLLRSHGYGTCYSSLYNFAVEPGFGLSYLTALDSGTWQR